MITFEEMLLQHEHEKVSFAGDWHGNTYWALQKIEQTAALGNRLILHVGDFGIWPGNHGKPFLEKLERQCQLSDVNIIVTLGNHEDWGRLEMLWMNPKRQDADGNLLPLRLTGHIWVLPRGYRFNISDVSFVSLGGAASIDFETRTKDRDWWLQEMIEWSDVEKVSAGGYADVFICHETPNEEFAVGAVRRILAGNPQGWSKTALSYSAVSRTRLTKAFLDVKPRILLHGHMHETGDRLQRLPDTDYDTRVVSLNCEHTAGNMYILDLATLNEEPDED